MLSEGAMDVVEREWETRDLLSGILERSIGIDGRRREGPA